MNIIAFWEKKYYNYNGDYMKTSYGKLSKLMQEKQIKKQDLKKHAKLGWSTISKISKNKDVSLEVLRKICEYLNCDVGDIVEFKNGR